MSDGKKELKEKTYNSRDSLVVTHPTTNRPACGLCAVNSRVGASKPATLAIAGAVARAPWVRFRWHLRRPATPGDLRDMTDYPTFYV